MMQSVLVAAALLGYHASHQGQVIYIETVTVVLPYQEVPAEPVARAAEEAAKLAAEAEQKKSNSEQEPVTEAVAATENAAAVDASGVAFAPNRSVADLGLGWGMASIGSGTLYPTPSIEFGSGGSGGLLSPFGSSGGGASFPPGCGCQSLLVNINNQPPDCNGGPSSPPVPEPMSLLVWGAALALSALLIRRRPV